MGPLRGSRRRRRRAEKKANEAAAAAAVASVDLPMRSLPDEGDWWDRFRRRLAGPLSASKDPIKFESLFKMSRKSFNYICSLVRDDMMAKATSYIFTDGTILALEDRVAIALRRLNSGDSLVNVGSSFGLNHSTVSQVTWHFVESMESRGLHHLQWPSPGETETIKSKFHKMSGLPNCCGAIAVTHITMNLPSTEQNANVWINDEMKQSMVLQAVVSPDLRFMDVVTGWPGSMSDANVLRNSCFYKFCEKGTILNCEKAEAFGGKEVREYIVGDDRYPLLPWLLTPYQDDGHAGLKEEFNRRHRLARAVAPVALARFKDMWKFLDGEMWRPDKHRLPRIILACCLMHNIIIEIEGKLVDAIAVTATTACDQNVKRRRMYCEAWDELGAVLREEVSQFLMPKSR